MKTVEELIELIEYKYAHKINTTRGLSNQVSVVSNVLIRLILVLIITKVLSEKQVNYILGK